MTIKTEMTAAPDCARLAAIHQACFAKPWDAQAFSEMLKVPGTLACIAEKGFGLVRCLGAEAELLTLAVVEKARGRGIAKALLARMVCWAKEQGALTFLLEVKEDNAAARSLYEKTGFQVIARRADYYWQPDGSQVSALVMRLVTNM